MKYLGGTLIAGSLLLVIGTAGCGSKSSSTVPQLKPGAPNSVSYQASDGKTVTVPAPPPSVQASINQYKASRPAGQ